jgi:hypothetical protein
MEHPRRYAQSAPDRTAVIVGDTGERRTYHPVLLFGEPVGVTT